MRIPKTYMNEIADKVRQLILENGSTGIEVSCKFIGITGKLTLKFPNTYPHGEMFQITETIFKMPLEKAELRNSHRYIKDDYDIYEYFYEFNLERVLLDTIFLNSTSRKEYI